MNYIFAISGADDEVYAVVCPFFENESWYTPKEDDIIGRWLNYNYGKFDDAVNLINEGEILYISTDFSNFLKCPKIYYNHDFDNRNILYYDDVYDLVSEHGEDSYIYLYDNNEEKWVKI